jgi:segregation and condensation protein A
MAAALAHRLRLLAAMQRAGAALLERPLLGRDVFARGAPEGLPFLERPVYKLSLYALLRAYGDGHRRRRGEILVVAPPALHSLDEALQRLGRLVGHIPEWRDLAAFLPEEARGGIFRRSALAATFAAALELARAGRLELRQVRAFGPIHLRSRPGSASGLREVAG